MATHKFTVNQEGTAHLVIDRGDILSFKAASTKIVLCVPANIFGVERFEIPAGETLNLVVQPNAPERSKFEFYSCSDPDFKCGGPLEEGKGDIFLGLIGP